MEKQNRLSQIDQANTLPTNTIDNSAKLADGEHKICQVI